MQSFVFSLRLADLELKYNRTLLLFFKSYISF